MLPHFCLYSSCSHCPESSIRHFCQLTIKSAEILVTKESPGGERQPWNKMRKVSRSWWDRDVTRAAEDVLIQHFLPVGCAGWFLLCSWSCPSGSPGCWRWRGSETAPFLPGWWILCSIQPTDCSEIYSGAANQHSNSHSWDLSNIFLSGNYCHHF